MATQFLVRSESNAHPLKLRTILHDGLEIRRSTENGVAVFEMTDPNVVIELVMRRNVGSAAAGDATNNGVSARKQCNKASAVAVEAADESEAKSPSRQVASDEPSSNTDPAIEESENMVNNHQNMQMSAHQWPYHAYPPHHPPPYGAWHYWHHSQRAAQWRGTHHDIFKTTHNDQEKDFEKTWDQKFNELVAFKKKHGHFAVPREENGLQTLNGWMKWQRRNYKTGKIQKDHLDRLNEIGFPWLSHHSNSWEQKFNELVAFKQKHGHFSVSKEVNPGLNSWIKLQIGYYNADKIEEGRLQRLNEIGFPWAMKKTTMDHIVQRYALEKAWDKKFNELVEFKQKHGHFFVPREENSSLHGWMKRQQVSYKDGNLREDRLARLNEIDFPWVIKTPMDKREQSWDRQFNELAEFKRKHGHFAVAMVKTGSSSLITWMKTQCQNYKDGKIREDRLQRLHEIGFPFPWDTTQQTLVNKQEESWDRQFNELAEFKRKHGHFTVPLGSLNSWVEWQRRNYKNGKIREDRFKRLNEIGFPWGNVWETLWNLRYSQLMLFKKEFGHCRVPQKYEKNRSLGDWVIEQRSKLKCGTLSEKRIAKLNELDFTWDCRKSAESKNTNNETPVDLTADESDCDEV